MAGLQRDTDAIEAIADIKKAESIPSEKVSEEFHDDVHEGLEFPTEEEIATLRRVSDAIPWNAYRTFCTL